MKIIQLLKFISDLNPQNTPARLAFYNFLRHFLFYSEDVTPSVINRFFAHCLEYPHWQTGKLQLGKEIQGLLENYMRFHQAEFAMEEIRFPQSSQIIEIDSFEDVIDAVSAYGKSIACETDKFRVVGDANKRANLIIQHQDGSMTISTFDKKFTIRGGLLEPLRTDFSIYYDDKLELKPGKIHTIELAPYLFGQFILQDGRIFGTQLRGYVFQKFAEMRGALLEEQTKIFVSVKKLEQHFIDRSTDPYYLNLVRDLKKLPSLLVTGDTSIERYAQILLDKGEIAFEEIFAGDKQLGLLIKDVRHALNIASTYNSNPRDHEEWQAINPYQQVE